MIGNTPAAELVAPDLLRLHRLVVSDLDSWYPAWPMLWSHTTACLQYSSRANVAVELQSLKDTAARKWF